MKHLVEPYGSNMFGRKFKTEIHRKNNMDFGERKKTIYDNDLCECGHKREDHKFIESHNYSDGKCLVEGCECNCDGGWFCYKNTKL